MINVPRENPPPGFGREIKRIDIPRFSADSRLELDKKGYKIYELKGRTVGQIVQDGLPLSSSWHDDEQSFLNLTSRRMEVAVFPKDPYMPSSGDKTLKEHEHMLSNYAKALARQFNQRDLALMIGDAPDYMELVLEHLKATGGGKLFGSDNGYKLTTTQTSDGSRIVIVGQFTEGGESVRGGLKIDRVLQEKHYKGVWCAPLIVPHAPLDPSVISADVVSLN